MYKILRNFLFLFDAELIHEFSVKFIKVFFNFPLTTKIIRRLFIVNHSSLEKKLFGLKFKNPVGLAAGFDKNAESYTEFSNFGFGFIEIGTVTPLPQPGNPKKRIFRLVEDESLINRLGFNNRGVKVIAENLKKRRDIIIGANIGKNFFTENIDAYNDYLKCLIDLNDYVDYFAINISSPNTKGLRDFHDQEEMKKLLTGINKIIKEKKIDCPIAIKISPDINDNDIGKIVDLVSSHKIQGIIVSNTTDSNRDNLSDIKKHEVGGLSGQPLKDISTN